MLTGFSHMNRLSFSIVELIYAHHKCKISKHKTKVASHYNLFTVHILSFYQAVVNTWGFKWFCVLKQYMLQSFIKNKQFYFFHRLSWRFCETRSLKDTFVRWYIDNCKHRPVMHPLQNPPSCRAPLQDYNVYGVYCWADMSNSIIGNTGRNSCIYWANLFYLQNFSAIFQVVSLLLTCFTYLPPQRSIGKHSLYITCKICSYNWLYLLHTRSNMIFYAWHVEPKYV
jgi:hypothetical protein